MNSHQCDFFVRRHLETHGTLTNYQQLLLELDERAILVLQKLHQTLVNADILIQSNSITNSEWLKAAIKQDDIKEMFSILLYEVQWHKSVLQSILVDNFKVSDIIFHLALCHDMLTNTNKLGL